MHRGKGMKFVGDSGTSSSKPNIPKDYSEYPGKQKHFGRTSC